MPRPRFSPWERTPIPNVQEAGWAPEPVWAQMIEEKLSPLLGIEPRARSQTIYWLSYPAHTFPLLLLVDYIIRENCNHLQSIQKLYQCSLQLSSLPISCKPISINASWKSPTEIILIFQTPNYLHNVCFPPSIPGRGESILPLASVSRPALWPTQPPVHWVLGVLSRGLKRGQGVTLTTHPI
jgi:hypothetical protein